MQKIKLIISFLSEKSKKIFGKIFPNNKLTNDNYLESSEEGKTTNNITPIDLSYSATYDTAVLYPETIIYNSQNDKTRITIGNDSHVRATLLIYPYGGEIRIGKNCYIGDTTRIWSAASVVIGNDVMISHNVNIIDTNSHETDPYERAVNSRKARLLGLPTVQGNVPSAPILIEDYVWINFNVVILKGVTIGEGAIIAAGAIVTKDVPAFSVVAGNPAKVVKVIKKSNQFKDLL